MNAHTTIVEAVNLAVRINGTTLLDGLTFSIPTGSLIGLIGPSGSGKTTLIRSIVGVQKYSGELRVLGASAGAAELRSKIGYVTQSPAVYGDLTVGQNVDYFSKVARADSGQVDRVIAMVDLQSQRQQLVGSLSGGQKARVSLAIALLGDPQLLLLDEPTVGLDPILRQELWQLFSRLAGEGKTLIVSSHVMDEAERCQRLLLMRGGQLLWQGPRKELLKRLGVAGVEEAFISMVKGAK